MVLHMLFIVVFGILMEDTAYAMIPSISEYFPDLATDLTGIEWAHATNSQKLLQESLNNESIHMLEADIVLGRLTNGGDERIPIMGHPPATTSDLSLQQFLTSVIEFQSTGKKGIKLDFKSIEVYNASWPIIQLLRDKLTFPVWINADILPGPVNATGTPVDGHNFLSLCKENLPDATLSPGWTTATHIGGGEYTQEQINAMKLLLLEDVKISQPITFPVRANFAARSATVLMQLVDDIDRSQGSNTTTLTIWMSSDTDVVDTSKLRSLIVTMGRHRVALDVPQRIRDALHLKSVSSPVSIANGALVAVLSSITAALNKVVGLKLF